MSDQLLQQIDSLISRRLGVFAEDIQHKLDLVVEGQHGLAEKVDRMDMRMDVFEAKVDHLGVRIDILETKVDHLGVRVDALETKVDHLSVRVDALDTKVDGLTEELRAHRRDTEAHVTCRAGG